MKKNISVAIYSSPFTLLLGNEHRVALCLCETVKIQPLKTTPQLQSHPSPAHPPSPRDSLPREGERERKGWGGKGGGGETDAHIKHILLLWHRKRKTHDVCGSPCFLEPFKVTAARVASAPFSTSSGPYLDNGMLRAACHDVQKLRSTFSALLLESCVYRSKKKKERKRKTASTGDGLCRGYSSTYSLHEYRNEDIIKHRVPMRIKRNSIWIKTLEKSFIIDKFIT